MTTVTRDPTISVSYCQQLENGQWVTNDSAYSTTPCVPDPADAVRYEQAGGDVSVPRCFTCTLSDWERADQRAAEQAGQASAAAGASTGSGSTGGDKWSRGVRDSFISNCAVYMDGSACQCLANHLSWQVPPDQAQGLSGEDPRVQVAAKECKA